MEIRTVDLFVIGGGINGAAIAADAAGRGLKVALCEKGDLASATSSMSSKLIHGGLRYLENRDFRLVREALKEREILLNRAPHLIQPLEFILPYEEHMRPMWMIRAGLFLYDHLAKRKKIPGSKAVNFAKSNKDIGLKATYQRGFSYYDCQTDDARLVILNTLSAKQNGADILTHTTCVQAKRMGPNWLITLTKANGDLLYYHAKALVNAAGPWVSLVNKDVIATNMQDKIDLVQGSHIVIPKLYEAHHAYILQNSDKRIVFAIPYQQHFTLIGTTDVPYQGDPGLAQISNNERTYLISVINHYFKKQISERDIVWEFSGVRPLYLGRHENINNPSKITRDFHLEIEDQQQQLPLLSVFGGKITTHRLLAEQAMQLLKRYFPQLGKNWTATEPLPGGNIGFASLKLFTDHLQQQYPWMPYPLLSRYAATYGTLTYNLLKGCKQVTDLGQDLGAGLHEGEVDYLKRNEWAQTMEDILWRRTKLGLIHNFAHSQTSEFPTN